MSSNDFRKFKKGIVVEPTAEAGNTKGSFRYDSATNKYKGHDGVSEFDFLAGTTATDFIKNQFPNVVKASYLTPTTGTPVSGTSFYSEITNRAPILDLENDLGCYIGARKTRFFELTEVYDEYDESVAPAAPVFKVTGDKYDKVRIVGKRIEVNKGPNTQDVVVDESGPCIIVNNVDSYIEFVDYGTDFYLEWVGSASTRDIRVSVDGGVESGNLIGSTVTALNENTFVRTNQMLELATGLSEGIHTIKIRFNSDDIYKLYGLVSVTDRTTIRVNPGIAIINGTERTFTAQSLAIKSSFESGTLGTTGGRVVVCGKSDQTVVKLLNPTGTTVTTIGSADHSNEEISDIRLFHQMGTSALDDFSNWKSPSSGVIYSNRWYGQEDGITKTTIGTTAPVRNDLKSPFGFRGAQMQGSNSFLVFDFVGTGLDIIMPSSATTFNFEISIDNTALGTLTNSDSTPGTANDIKMHDFEFIRVASDLPFGTHTVYITTSTNNETQAIYGFVQYITKKPDIPEGYIELGEYHIMGDFVAPTTTAAYDNIGQGVQRYHTMKGVQIEGTGWATTSSYTQALPWGQYLYSDTGSTTEIITKWFFGTGVVINAFSAPNDNASVQLTIDGVTDFSGNTTSFVGAGDAGFTASTGIIDLKSATNSIAFIEVSGLTEGWHKLTMSANTTTDRMLVTSFDVVSSLHTLDGQKVGARGNCTVVGGQAIKDTRKFSYKEELEKAHYCTTITTSSFSTTVDTPYMVSDIALEVESDGVTPMMATFQATVDSAATSSVEVWFMMMAGMTMVGYKSASRSNAFKNTVYIQSDPFVLPKGRHAVYVTVQNLESNTNNHRLFSDRKLVVREL